MSANSPAPQTQAATTELELSCQRRGELFARCFTRYADAMDQLTDALGQYDGLLRNGPKWGLRQH